MSSSRRPRWGRATLATRTVGVLLVVGLAAGCGSVDDGEPQTTPSAGPSSADPKARYARLAGACPSLTSSAAAKVNGVGEGTVTGPDSSLGGLKAVRCTWDPQRKKRPSVNVGVLVYQDGFAPTNTGDGNARKSFADMRAEAAAKDTATSTFRDEPTERGESFLLVDSVFHAVTLTTRIDNAVVTCIVYGEETFTGDQAAERADLLRRYRDASRVITADVVDDLR